MDADGHDVLSVRRQERNDLRKAVAGSAPFERAFLRRNSSRDSHRNIHKMTAPQHHVRQSEQIAAPQSAHSAAAWLPHGEPTPVRMRLSRLSRLSMIQPRTNLFLTLSVFT
jgi:hypothetical protein